MIGKRRVLSVINEFSTLLLPLFFLYGVFYLCLYFFQIDEGFFSFCLTVLNALFYTAAALNLIVIVLSFLFWISDYSFETGYVIRSIIRTALEALILFVIQILEIAVNRGLSLKL